VRGRTGVVLRLGQRLPHRRVRRAGAGARSPAPAWGDAMIELRDITYVRLGTRDLEGATRYATDILGLEIAERSGRSVYFRSDAREHTLCYFDGDPGDHAVAFEVGTRAELDAAAAELERIGHPVHAGTRAECDLRKVQDFIAFDDPTGNRIELVWRPQMSGRGFRGTRDAGI